MATVWAAVETALGREVAVKRAIEPENHGVVLREATVTAQLEHPNIVPIHQLWVDAAGPAVVMKRIAGRSWYDLMEDPKSTLDRHLEIFLQVLNAIEFAHSRGVIHRDIKPENVMVGDYGEVYVLDWGVAKLGDEPASNAIVGTPCYMAPEMAEGRADERTDIFLLGATLHEALTGEPRHLGDEGLHVLYAAMYVEPFEYEESVPFELGEICNRACARAPQDRFQNVAALREAVVRYREHRAAGVLCEAAQQMLADLRELIGRHSEVSLDMKSAHDRQVQHLFGEARLSFDAALKIWRDSPSAREGRDACLRTMLDYELARGHLDASRALLSLFDAPDAQLESRVTALATRQALERARVAHMEREQDPRVGALARSRAYLSLGLSTGLMTLGVLLWRSQRPNEGPSTPRLTLVGGVVFLVMLGVTALWRRYGEFNAVNRRIAQVSLAALALSFASRLSGYLTETPPERLLITDAFLLCLGGLALTPYHRAGRWLAAISFAVAALGTARPSFVDELFIVLSLSIPLALLLLRRKTRRDREQSEPIVDADVHGA
jgi:serine/threonine-protein kinase